MRIKTNYYLTKYLLFSFIALILSTTISPVFYKFLNYILINFQPGDISQFIISSFAILIAFYTFFANQRHNHNDKINEQIYLIEGLFSELDIISSNISWYKKEIENNLPKKLDHPINKVHMENFLTRINGKFFNKEGFKTISNINDKINQLNTQVSEVRSNKNFKLDQGYCSGIIGEVEEKIKNLKENLKEQKEFALKERI